MTHLLQQSRFRRISASVVRASEKVQLSRIGSRLHAFQRTINEVSTLPLTPPKGGSKSEFVVEKNNFPYISITDEASDFKFGMQLWFANAHHHVPLKEKVGVTLD